MRLTSLSLAEYMSCFSSSHCCLSSFQPDLATFHVTIATKSLALWPVLLFEQGSCSPAKDAHLFVSALFSEWQRGAEPLSQRCTYMQCFSSGLLMQAEALHSGKHTHTLFCLNYLTCKCSWNYNSAFVLKLMFGGPFNKMLFLVSHWLHMQWTRKV